MNKVIKLDGYVFLGSDTKFPVVVEVEVRDGFPMDPPTFRENKFQVYLYGNSHALRCGNELIFGIRKGMIIPHLIGSGVKDKKEQELIYNNLILVSNFRVKSTSPKIKLGTKSSVTLL